MTTQRLAAIPAQSTRTHAPRRMASRCRRSVGVLFRRATGKELKMPTPKKIGHEKSFIETEGLYVRFFDGKADRYKKPLMERFWEKVDKGGEDDCWIWTGNKFKDGYGSFSFRDRPHRAHRVSWIHFNGKRIPDGCYVCHSCDNPLCVNPKHLWVGTPTDNVRDMISKGRAKPIPKGVKWNITHCKNGHELTPENSIIDCGGRHRRCRTCRTAQQKIKTQKQNKIKRDATAARRAAKLALTASMSQHAGGEAEK